MGFRTLCECDTCDGQIDVTDGSHPARVNASAPTPSSVGPQPEESYLCKSCWDKLCTAFPRFKEAERFAIPAPVSAPTPQSPPVLDTVSPEALLVLLATKLGVQVKRTEE